MRARKQKPAAPNRLTSGQTNDVNTCAENEEVFASQEWNGWTKATIEIEEERQAMWNTYELLTEWVFPRMLRWRKPVWTRIRLSG